MQVTIEISAGADHDANVTKKDIQGNIDALERILHGRHHVSDWISLNDTISILLAIRRQLP